MASAWKSRTPLGNQWRRGWFHRIGRRLGGLRVQNRSFDSANRHRGCCMTKAQFDTAYQAFRQRRPFRTILIEFMSGSELPIGHPEAVRKEGDLYLTRCADGTYVVFPAEAVCRVLDVPVAARK